MKQLKIARERYGFTQAQLAEAIGTTQQTIGRWETGKAEPNLAALRDLAICLNTTVDNLVGRRSRLEPQTTNPVAWVRGDKSGYWGNIGLKMPNEKFSRWYPITTATMEKVYVNLQGVEKDGWIAFQTLNNKMVICKPSAVEVFTFLNEAEDQIEGDWEVGFDDIEGMPQEFYECLEYLLWGGLAADDEEAEFSKKLIAMTQGVIDENELTENSIMDICVKTKVTYVNGSERNLHVSPRRLAEAFFDFDIGIENTDKTMLHLDDEGGDHSVFLSLDLLSRLEFPLLSLKEGLDNMDLEDVESD